MEEVRVKQFIPKAGRYVADVPASKSIFNRALLLAALAKGDVRLYAGALGGDTRAMLGCIRALGIAVEELEDGLLVHGCGGNIPNANAQLDVASAGTAARFLPAALAFCGGDYRFTASSQMAARPMEILSVLERAGAVIERERADAPFPFVLHSRGVTAEHIDVETNVSTQYLSGLIIGASAGKAPVTICPHGDRASGSYVKMTLEMLPAFHAGYMRSERGITVQPAQRAPQAFHVEGDLSGACYFFALALLFGIRILVRRVTRNTLQGDSAFLNLLEEKGVRFEETEDGLLADGSSARFTGFDANFCDFSDQTLTAAAIAPFASTPSVLRGVEHISRQECDRIQAIVENINALGGSARTNGQDIFIQPIPLTGGRVKSFSDHRVAMAFSLAGLKTGTVTIDDPACTNKTFEGFFSALDGLILQ